MTRLLLSLSPCERMVYVSSHFQRLPAAIAWCRHSLRPQHGSLGDYSTIGNALMPAHGNARGVCVFASQEHPVRPLSDFLVQDPSRDIPTPAPHTQLQTQTQPQAHAQPPQPSQQVHAHPSCGDKRAAEGTTTITISDTTDPDCTPTPTCNTDQAAPQHVSKQARLDSPAKELDTRLREDTTNGCSADSSTMAEGASSSLDPWSFFMVPHKTLDQSADVVDVVTSRSTR